MLKKVLVVAAVLVLGLVVWIAVQPSTYRVQRSTQVHAPPERVFTHLSDLRRFDAWSPWAKLDPDMKRTHEGAWGVGQSYSWEGNDQVGSGKMTVTAVTPNEAVEVRLDFFKPFESLGNTTEWRVTPKGTGSEVTWSMRGNQNFVGKAFSMLMDMDEVVGADFEKGLAALKAQVEQPAPTPLTEDALVPSPPPTGNGQLPSGTVAP